MTSDALTYLKEQTVRWINLDRSPERRATWEDQIAPLFKQAIRVTATDWRVIPDEAAVAFIKQWNEQYVRHQLSQSTVFMHEPQSPSRFRMSTAKANCAIRNSHLRALRDAIAVNTGERILIAEDDIAPRNALWTERIDLPPEASDGSTVMASGPRNVGLHYESSCNLACPTCRSGIETLQTIVNFTDIM